MYCKEAVILTRIYLLELQPPVVTATRQSPGFPKALPAAYDFGMLFCAFCDLYAVKAFSDDLACV